MKTASVYPIKWTPITKKLKKEIYYSSQQSLVDSIASGDGTEDGDW